jgi:hypothetical protein
MAEVRALPTTMTQAFKVRLESSSDPSDLVIFDVSPEVSEECSVNYQPLNPVHMPGNIWVYQNTESRNFNITARLVARTTREARRNMEYFNLLRGWCQPYFGLGTSKSQSQQSRTQSVSPTARAPSSPVIPGTGQQRMKNLLGAPPDVLYLSAYSGVIPQRATGPTQNSSPTASSSREHLGNIYRVPVVIKNFSHVYPADVDYIPTAGGGVNFDVSDQRTGVPFPTIMTVTIALLEVHSPTSFAKNFDLYSYKLGILGEF